LHQLLLRVLTKTWGFLHIAPKTGISDFRCSPSM
jgi:hypothetical protein